ncbi:MAG: IclR family transcriptional regulator [Actinomycetaceae bacterium]|nr:IclR family transcriptional regulator [Actinomycetaceae bacterium]
MTITESTETGVRDVKSASRTVELLEYLASRQANPPHLNEICRALGAPRSSVYALLRTLLARGWVSASANEGYSLGIRILTTGTSYIDADPRVRVVRPILTDLASDLGETFHMARLDGDRIVYLATQESSRDLRPYSRVGRRLPATAAALGKAILAQRPDVVPEAFEQLTPHSIADAETFAGEMDVTRQRGYAIDDEENTLGLHCVAMALPYASPVTDAISCSVPSKRWSAQRVVEIVEKMRDAVVRIVESAPLAH